MVPRDMGLVMAAEAARKIGVAQIVGIRAPADLKFGKHIFVVKIQKSLGGLFNVGRTRLINVGM